MKVVRYAKYPFFFCAGGTCYMTLELLWRGWSHGSMFLAGGTCFLLLGELSRMRLPVAVKAVLGAGVITGVELLTGLVVNRDYRVWDYRSMPLSYQGQVCLPYSLLWIPVGVAAMGLYRKLDQAVS